MHLQVLVQEAGATDLCPYEYELLQAVRGQSSLRGKDDVEAQGQDVGHSKTHTSPSPRPVLPAPRASRQPEDQSCAPPRPQGPAHWTARSSRWPRTKGEPL